MKKLTRISINIPEDLLIKACRLSNLNQTEALIAGLHELIGKHERLGLIRLKGKIKINIDLDKTRERNKL